MLFYAYNSDDYIIYGFYTHSENIPIETTANSSKITNNSISPVLKDNDLKVETVFSGVGFPSSMAFLGPNDILVLDKNNGTVHRIVNGHILSNPLLDVNVSTLSERGMLGVAVTPNDDLSEDNNKFAANTTTTTTTTFVYLYYTESPLKDGEDISEENKPLGNRLYKYELVHNHTKLANPALLLELPALPGPFHNGGRAIIGPDGNLYLTVGDLNLRNATTQNVINGDDPNGSGGILRITLDGKAVERITGNGTWPDLYYAYGIRNSFGIDFDPVSGKMWDTENGPYYGDEINLVEPGFNSGWKKVQGIWKPNGELAGAMDLNPQSELVDFYGKGKYRAPEFIWNQTVGPTALTFLESNKLGKEYENDMFVGDFHNGNLYHFDLNKNRTHLILKNHLSDRIANSPSELGDVVFGQGFGGITDIKVGPDGYPYILSLSQGGEDCLFVENPCIAYDSSNIFNKGIIYRIAPKQ